MAAALINHHRIGTVRNLIFEFYVPLEANICSPPYIPGTV